LQVSIKTGWSASTGWLSIGGSTSASE
jgi:hypothetical protein